MLTPDEETYGTHKDFEDAPAWVREMAQRIAHEAIHGPQIPMPVYYVAIMKGGTEEAEALLQRYPWNKTQVVQYRDGVIHFSAANLTDLEFEALEMEFPEVAGIIKCEE